METIVLDANSLRDLLTESSTRREFSKADELPLIPLLEREKSLPLRFPRGFEARLHPIQIVIAVAGMRD